MKSRQPPSSPELGPQSAGAPAPWAGDGFCRDRPVEDRFQRHFDAPLGGAAIYAPDKRWIEVNDTLCTLLGRTRADLERLTWMDLVHPDDLDHRLRLFTEALSGRRDSFVMETRFVRPDGTVVQATVSEACVRGGTGGPDCFVMRVDDVTRHARAAADLSRALDLAHIGWWDWDVEGDRVRWSDQASAILGRGPASRPGPDALFRAIHPEDRKRMRAAFRRRPGTPDHFREAFRIVRPDRAVRHVETAVAVTRDRAGAVLRLFGTLGDVTAQRESETALRDSECRLRDMVEASADWSWETGPDLAFTAFSAGFKTVAGVDPGYFLGRRRQDLSPDAPDGAGWPAHLADLAARRPFRHFRYRLALPDGRLKTVMASGKPVFERDGRFLGYRGTGIDATTESAGDGDSRLAEAYRRLIAAVEGISDAFALWDADDRLVVCNDRFQRLFAAPGHRIAPGTPFADTVRGFARRGLVPGDPTEVARWVRRRLSEHRLARSNSEHSLADGRAFLISERRADGGAIVGLYTDITNLKKAEQALRESEERYRKLVELSPDSILVHAGGTIVFANAAAQRTFAPGRPDGPAGRALTALGYPAADQAREGPFETVLRRLDGAAFDAEVVSTPIVYQGAPAGLLVVRDVTERKRVQQQLIQAGKLATLGEMAAGIAHELSQPLNIIKLSAEGTLLQMRRGRGGPEAKRRQLEVIDEQAGRMARIIDHMRVFARKDTEGDREAFDLRDAVREATGLVADQYRLDDVEVILDLPPRCRPVLGHPIQFEQVILNFLANGFDAIRERRARTGMPAGTGGVITVSMTDPPAGGPIEIDIRDNGCGIPPAVAEHVFEPFFTTKESGRGTGLGMSISYGIVARMGGDVTVLDADDGAAFRITVPAAPGAGAFPESPAEAALEPPSPAWALDRFHVMVVDDETLAGEAVAGHLRGLGYRVTTCADGQEAFERYLDDPADLLITDLRMPRLDGAELIRRLGACDPDLPVLVVTGHPAPGTGGGVLDRPSVRQMFRKPVGLERLEAAVAAILTPESPAAGPDVEPAVGEA